jgi:prophage tail gpP-like protein
MVDFFGSQNDRARYTVLVGGEVLYGWKSFTITNSINTPVATAKLDYKDFTPSKFDEVNAVLEIRYKKIVIFKGHIFGTNKLEDPTTLTYSLEARNFFSDLFDSSIGYDPIFKGSSFIGMLTSACRKYKATTQFLVKIKNKEPVSKVEKEKALPEENIWEYLSVLAKKRQVIPMVYPDNTLKVADNVYLLGQKSGLAIIHDRMVNNAVTSTTVNIDKQNLFHTYGYVSDVSSQKSKAGKPVFKSGAVTDPSIRKTRISYENIRVEEDKSLALRKIKWKKSVAEGSQKTVTVTTPSMLNNLQKLWKIGDYVDYTNDYIGIIGVYLITDVEYSFSVDRGQSCTLTLVDPRALLPEPPDAVTDKQNKRELQQKARNKKRNKKKGILDKIPYAKKIPLPNLLGE